MVRYVFWAFKMLQMMKMRAGVELALRQRRQGTTTAEDVLDKVKVDRIVSQDEGFRMLRHVPYTPPYWQSKMKMLMAMIR